MVNATLLSITPVIKCESKTEKKHANWLYFINDTYIIILEQLINYT